MAQPLQQSDFHFDLDDDHPPISQLKGRSDRIFRLTLSVSLLISSLAIIYVFSTYGLVQDGLNYRNNIMNKEMLPFWQTLAIEEEGKNNTQIIQEGEHQISRQELGKMGWTLLHMMTGAFPEEITPELAKKWNTFLLLFGHFYPCKLCSSHFLKMQKELTPFSGNKKEELMVYLCQMHNKVNERLGKPIHDCSKVKQEWNTCGCRDA